MEIGSIFQAATRLLDAPVPSAQPFLAALKAAEGTEATERPGSVDSRFQAPDGTVKGSTLASRGITDGATAASFARQNWAELGKLSAPDRAELARLIAKSPEDTFWIEDGGTKYGLQRSQVLPHIHAAEPLSAGYIDASQGTAMKGAGAFLKTVDLEKLERDWPSMGEDRKLKVMQGLHDAMCQAYGVPPVRIKTEQVDPKTIAFVSEGSYDFGTNELLINVHPNTSHGASAKEALETVFHETIHRKQDFQIGNSKGIVPEMAASPGDYALLFVNNQENGYVPSIQAGRLYSMNPTEQEAFVLANGFRQSVGLEPLKDVPAIDRRKPAGG